MLYASSQLLMAICDIKDKKKARETHEVILSVINVPNLMKIMIDIFIYKIGGNKEKQRIYEYDI